MAIRKIISRSITDGAVVATDVAALSIDSTKLASNAVTNAKIASNAISSDKLDTNIQFGFKNRIINGDMVIDQRGGTVTINSAVATYGVDRWAGSGRASAGVFSIRQTANYPAGFTKSLYVTVGTADASLAVDDLYAIQQRIEGYNIADLNWGTANAKTVTLSFWVRSSLTGAFGGSITNSAFNRSYPFTYTISSANTWEQKSVTIAGDTTGTWLADNGVGMRVYWGLGIGSNYLGTAGSWVGAGYVSATGSNNVMSSTSNDFYITGVQLEVGSSATGFEYVNYQTSLANCQRYYYKALAGGTVSTFGSGVALSTVLAVGLTNFPVTMRTSPTALEQSGTATDYRVYGNAGGTTCSAVPIIAASTGSPFSASTSFTVASGLTAGQGQYIQSANTNGFLAWSAEL